MNTCRMAVCCLLIGMLGTASTAKAKEEGFYIGGSVGSVSIEEEVADFDDIDIEDIDIDESDLGFKIFAGYQFSGLFALEGGYVDFGNPSNGEVEIDSYGIDAFAVLGIPIGPIRGFAKAGGIYWDSDTDVDVLDDAFSESDDGVDLAAGLGLELELGGLGFRGEVEYFDFAGDVWFYSLGATLTF